MNEGFADTWNVHRHILGSQTGLLHRQPTLHIAETASCFTAAFALAGGSTISILLTRQPFGNAWNSYYGAGSLAEPTGPVPFHSRILYLGHQDPDRKFLVGHLSRQADYKIRDFFVAVRNTRRQPPDLGKKTFEFSASARLRVPLQDCELPTAAGISRLSENEITIEGYTFRITAWEPTENALHFRGRLDKQTIGGLVAPLDEGRPQQLLVVCYRHHHVPGHHPPDPDVPVGDSPGHPICTTLYGAVTDFS
jgi:hypothetical protein